VPNGVGGGVNGYPNGGLKKLPHSGSSDEDPYSLTPSGYQQMFIFANFGRKEIPKKQGLSLSCLVYSNKFIPVLQSQ
jgi:hypothetical protein